MLKKYDTIPGTQTPNTKGLHWVELKMPPDRTSQLTAEDKAALTQRGALTPEKQAAINAALAKMPTESALQDALKYEGDQMGHCVGGYCGDVKEGRSRIFSLRDSKGQPHVTVEVQPAKDNVVDDRRLERAGLYRPVNDYLFGDRSLDDLKNAIKKKGLNPDDFIGRYEQAINQIKGKANRAPNDEYLPFVQDFVQTQGPWSSVGDIKNTGLVDVTNRPKIAQHYGTPYITDNQLNDFLNQFGSDVMPGGPTPGQ